jgi:hypothetical protein
LSGRVSDLGSVCVGGVEDESGVASAALYWAVGRTLG